MINLQFTMKLKIFIIGVFIIFVTAVYANFRPKCLPFDFRSDFVRAKEIIVDRMVYGAYDKTLWNINLSDKRFMEADRFGICGDNKRKIDSMQKANSRRSLAEKYFDETKKGGEDMNYLNERMEKNKVLTEGVK